MHLGTEAAGLGQEGHFRAQAHPAGDEGRHPHPDT